VYDVESLNNLYKEASVFIYPSLAEQGETFGLAPLEAMAWGCVPIVSNLQCFKDFIGHNKNGLVFNHRANNKVSLLSETINDLLKDETLLSKLASEAIKVCKTHAIKTIANRFLEEFENIVTEPAIFKPTVS
jgi:glycosyltransferase involved in cell wall biosynthesis